jgi:hypothetical protein
MGKFNGLSLGGIVGGVILLVIAFAALTAVIPTLNDALGNLTWQACDLATGVGCSDIPTNVTNAATGIPFASLFNANGVIVLALLGAVVLGVVAYFGLTGSKR